ncbi:MAG: hypothetical protein HYS07_06970 [Chlamydiae bacterium]|nr:hypothetical protein [Chlamydiota bacterium]MBI3277523.1 hypothetical protein [Chlamydiota bacterium]
MYEEETLVTPSNSVPCPKCGSPENVIPIVYGYPSQGLMDRADQGKVKLGGCVIGGNDPHYYCKKCEQSW